MIKLNEEQLKNVIGGSISITGSLVNAFVTGIETIMDVGRSLGTAIRRMVYGYKC